TRTRGLSFHPGVAKGFIAENDPDLVAISTDAVGSSPDDTLLQHLTYAADITTLSRPLVEKYAKLTGRSDVASLAADATAFQAFATDRQLIDLFTSYPERLDSEQLRGLLRPLPPRL